MPAPGYSTCIENNLSTMIDPATATFKVRSTGRPRAGSKLKRSLTASFRRRSFLDFLDFTEFETTDPVNYDSDDQAWARNCGDRYRNQRNGTARRSCSLELLGHGRDQGPAPHQRRHPDLWHGSIRPQQRRLDRVQRPGSRLGEVGTGADPVFNGPQRAGVKSLGMPPTNTTLQNVATTGGLVYQGTTRIRFNSATNNMTVTNSQINGGSPRTRSLPTNGVIYVANRSGGLGTLIPPERDLREPCTCGNLYVSGTYTTSMTLAAANDIIIAPPGSSRTNGGTGNADVIGSGNSVMGLVANNFVRVYHPCPKVSPLMNNVHIDAPSRHSALVHR